MKKFKTKKNLNIRMMFFLVMFLLTLILYLDISSNFSSGLISLIEPVVKQNLTKSLSDNFKLSILKNYDIDVIFAGHSLGGQLRLPFWGATLKKDGASVYTNDYYNENNTKLYVSYGIGTNPPHIRTFNKPSINVYRLKKI